MSPGTGEPGAAGPVREVALALGIAAAYVVSGTIGIWIAPPSPYPTLLWPAAGVALAALVVFGARRWPGVWLGGFLLVMSPDALAVGGVFFALLLATGIAAQAALGAALVRPLLQKPLPLTTPAAVVHFVTRAGPVSCLTFAITVVGAQTILGSPGGAVDAASVFASAWVGDTLGVVLIAPLLLLAWPRTAGAWVGVRWTLAATLVAAVVVLAAMNLVAHRLAERDRQERLHGAVVEAIGSAQASVAGAVQLMRGVERFLAASDHVTREEFTVYTAPLLASAGVVGVNWAPRVPHDALASFEAQARVATGRDDFRVFEPTAAGRLAPAAARAEHYPVLYTVPEAANGALVGVDQGFQRERREAMSAAVGSARGFAIAAVESLVTGDLVLLFHLPHYGADVDTNALQAEGRRTALLGYVIGAVEPRPLFGDKLALARREGMALRSTLRFGDEAVIVADSFPQGLATRARVGVDDPELSLLVEAAFLEPPTPNPYYSWIALLSGMFVATTALIGAGRQVGTDAEVAARTAELREARHAAEQANRAKSFFLATMSHEIRTPMNGVLGMLDVLEHSDLGANQRDPIRTMRSSATTLLTLIDDILDYSKVEAGRVDLEHAPFGLTELVEESCASHAAVARSRGVALRVFVDPNRVDRVVGDATRLRQVLDNLVANAVKFSVVRRDQAGVVTVRVESAAADPTRVIFSVEDDGIGIEEEVQARLFTPFVQAEASTTRRFGGTGLGLAISKRLVDLMGGTIAVSSRPGEGSRFTVTLPLETAPHEPSGPTAFDLSGLRCFLVDDGEVFADALHVYLRHAGAIVRRIAAADRALADATTPGDAPVVIVVLGETAFRRLPRSPRPGNVHFVRIGRGNRRRPRVLAADAVMIDADALGRRPFLHAVAVAARRASPEVFDENVVQGPPPSMVAPSVVQARAANRLILVAEDDEVSREVIVRQLALLGYAAEVVTDGATALAHWRRGGYALVITDVHMPDMDGYELTAEIRRHETAERRVPIIALTANALRGESERARAAGMDAYLTKPVPIGALREALRAWLPPTDAVPSADPDDAPRSTDEVRPLDLDALKRIVGDDPATVHRFVVMFADELDRSAAELRAAVLDGDRDAVHALAHKLKASSRTLGAAPLGDLFDELEASAKSGDVAALQLAMPRFEQSIAEFRAALAPLLATGGRP